MPYRTNVFFHCNMKNTNYRTDTYLQYHWLRCLCYLLCNWYFLRLQFVLYFLQFVFFFRITHLFLFLLRTVLIPNISPLQYIHVFFFSFFFFIQIICFNYSAARTLLNAVQTTSFWELPCTKGQFQRENMNPFSIKRIIFIVLITYVTYLASENSSVKASKQAFKEVTGTGTQSLRNNSPQRSSNSRGVLHNYSSFVRYFPKIVFMRHSGFPDSNLPRVYLDWKFERSAAKRTQESRRYDRLTEHVI